MSPQQHMGKDSLAAAGWSGNGPLFAAMYGKIKIGKDCIATKLYG